MSFHYLYVLVNLDDQRTYIGYTNDLSRRMAEHKRRHKKGKIRKHIELIYFEAYKSSTKARKREISLKKSSWHKKQLFNRIFDQ